MPKHFIYILESANGKYYTGYTTDLERRMKQHAHGTGSKFVRAFGFKALLYHEAHRTNSKALKREAEIKKWSRKKKICLITSHPKAQLQK
ncbi:MAG TPA: endonuclease [Deltaproteobacteria bacterium]|nr:endonuclease [Deltaproteobacteria bacterium]